MARWGIYLVDRPMLRVDCSENLVDIWTTYMGQRKRPLVWKPLKSLAVDSRAIVGVRKLPRRKAAQKRVGGFAKSA